MKLFTALANTSQDTRHAFFVWGLTVSCYAGIMAALLLRQGELAGKVVDALSGIMEVVVCTYLGVDCVHRSGMLGAIGDRFKASDADQPPSPTQ